MGDYVRLLWKHFHSHSFGSRFVPDQIVRLPAGITPQDCWNWFGFAVMTKKKIVAKKKPAAKKARTKYIKWVDTHRKGESYEWEEYECSGCKVSVFNTENVRLPEQCPFCKGKVKPYDSDWY